MSRGLPMRKLVRAVQNQRLIITPRLNQWLMQHGDDPLEPWVVDIIAELMGTRPRIRYSSFAASSAGACERRQVLQFLGVDPGGAIDPQLQNIFNDGKWRHLRWQAMLLQAGIISEVEFTLQWPKMRSWGTMDGLGVVPGDHPMNRWRDLEFGFELKGVSTFQFQKFKSASVKEDHHKQFDRYFLSGGYDLFVVIYEDKTTQDWIEWVYEPDTERLMDSKDELSRLNSSVDQKRLPLMQQGCMAHKGPEWKDCPYGGDKTAPCPQMGSWPDEKLIRGVWK